RNEEHERDEIEEALRRDSKRRPGNAEEDRHDPEDEDDSDCGGICRSTITKPRKPGPVPPSDSGPRIDDPADAIDSEPGHEGERDQGRPSGPKAEKEEEAREREQISDGRGGRVRGRICVGYRADQDSGREEGDAVLARDTPCDQEDRDDGQSAQDRHEDVQHGRKVEAGEMGQPSLQEEHAREIRIRDAPSVVRRRDVAGPDEISENREVLARVRTPIEERPKRGESDRDRAEDEGRETEGGRLPHSSANRRALLKGYPRIVASTRAH